MRMRWTVLMLLVPALMAGQHGKKKQVSAYLGVAQYAWVEAMDGDAFSPQLLPEDRDAIAEVEGGIRDWHRYHLTAQRREAELVFVVRKGRLGTAKLGVGVGNAGQFPGGRGPMGRQGSAGAEVGPPDDILEVHQITPEGKVGPVLWMGSMQDGLDGPDVPLLRQLRKAVDQDYPPNGKKP